MMRPLREFRRSLVVRIGAIFTVLLLLTSVAAVVTIRRFVRSDMEEATRREMIGVVKRLEGDLARVRNEALLFARFSSRTVQAHNDRESGGAALQIAVVEESRGQGIEIAEYAAGLPAAAGKEVLRRGFAGMQTVDYVLEPAGTDRLQVFAVAPLGEAERERKVVTASIPLGRDFLRRESASVGGDISIFAEGTFVTSSSTCFHCIKCLESILGAPGAWGILEGGRSIYATFECGPDSEAVAVVPVRTFDGRTAAFSIFRSRQAEKAALFHATVVLAAGSLAFTGAMMFVFFLLTSRMTRPLKDLTRLSVTISEGRYGETIPVAGEDEVAELAGAFNRMSVSLEAAHREISDWNRLLESRVEDKTRELEKVHRQMVEVEKLAAVGQLASGVAHELNNPLSGILGYAEVALELHRNNPAGLAAAEENARLISYFGHIETLSQRCRTIILDMLTFARHHTEEARDLGLNDIIGQTLAFLEQQIGRRKVRLVTEFAEELPPFRGNALQLQQVFTNLIINALQAMPDGGTLTVRTRRVGDAVEADVADTGVGIDRELKNRIFEPFFTTKPVGEGTGLGLSVSYGIVKRHKGEIRVASEPGQGSVFTVVIPLAAI